MSSTATKISAETYQQYVNRLHRDMDYRILGEGMFGTVFLHPTFNNVVVKVVRGDAVYKDFAKFCKAHPNNPWLPKVASISAIKLDDATQAYAVFLEKLTEVNEKSVRTFAKALAARFDLGHVHPFKWFDKEGWLKIAEEVRGDDPDFSVLAAYLATRVKHLDLHPQNLMRRGGQLVFIDPLS